MKNTIKNIQVFIPLLTLLFAGQRGFAQGELATWKSIYRQYDSLPGISFNARYVYSSDTVSGNFLYDAADAHYLINGGKALYNIGSVEFMQNDSFVVAVYKDDNVIILGDAPAVKRAGALPLRTELDSLFEVYASMYTITSGEIDSLDYGYINFESDSSAAPFKEFRAEYSISTKLLRSLNYEFVAEEEAEGGGSPILRTRRLTISFSDYHYGLEADLKYPFEETNYVYPEGDKWVPVAKYNSFRVFDSRAVR